LLTKIKIKICSSYKQLGWNWNWNSDTVVGVYVGISMNKWKKRSTTPIVYANNSRSAVSIATSRCLRKNQCIVFLYHVLYSPLYSICLLDWLWKNNNEQITYHRPRRMVEGTGKLEEGKKKIGQ
jgi:hypothetical protein